MRESQIPFILIFILMESFLFFLKYFQRHRSELCPEDWLSAEVPPPQKSAQTLHIETKQILTSKGSHVSTEMKSVKSPLSAQVRHSAHLCELAYSQGVPEYAVREGVNFSFTFSSLKTHLQSYRQIQ